MGIRSARGVEAIDYCVVETKATGGCLKEYCMLLVMVGMCLSKYLKENDADTKRVSGAPSYLL